MKELFELYWAAGFWDGEGCSTGRRVTRKNGSTYRYPCLVIGQVNRDNLERFQAAVGCGRIKGPYYHSYEWKNNRSSRPASQWTVTNKADAQTVYRVLAHRLGSEKREQMEQMLKEAELMDEGGNLLPVVRRRPDYKES